MNPRALAEKLLAELHAARNFIASAGIAGPGFINFTFAVPYLHSIARQSLAAGQGFGRE